MCCAPGLYTVGEWWSDSLGSEVSAEMWCLDILDLRLVSFLKRRTRRHLMDARFPEEVFCLVDV